MHYLLDVSTLCLVKQVPMLQINVQCKLSIRSSLLDYAFRKRAGLEHDECSDNNDYSISIHYRGLSSGLATFASVISQQCGKYLQRFLNTKLFMFPLQNYITKRFRISDSNTCRGWADNRYIYSKNTKHKYI